MLVTVIALLTVCLAPPVPGPIVAPFIAPACPYCAGHRTVDFAANIGDEVVAPVTGRIVFAGWVVDQSFFTIEVPPMIQPTKTGRVTATEKILITLGNVTIGQNVALNQRVRAGDPIGRAEGLIRLSMRDGRSGEAARYRDPAAFLGTRRQRIRLVPNSRIGARPVRLALECRQSLVGDTS